MVKHLPNISNVTHPRLKQLQRASLLAQITIFYNLLEGIVSILFGVSDETLSLFGFGIDSFVEVLSGIGIYNMVRKMRLNPDANVDPFEKKHSGSQASHFICWQWVW